jgi:hypothetical protein
MAWRFHYEADCRLASGSLTGSHSTKGLSFDSFNLVFSQVPRRIVFPLKVNSSPHLHTFRPAPSLVYGSLAQPLLEF